VTTPTAPPTSEEATALSGDATREVGRETKPDAIGVGVIVVRGSAAGGEPYVPEPESCARWGWFSWEATPKPLFLPVSLRASRFRP
jgi:hypothetical protein